VLAVSASADTYARSVSRQEEEEKLAATKVQKGRKNETDFLISERERERERGRGVSDRERER
jgi:hypothetical protein